MAGSGIESMEKPAWKGDLPDEATTRMGQIHRLSVKILDQVFVVLSPKDLEFLGASGF